MRARMLGIGGPAGQVVEAKERQAQFAAGTAGVRTKARIFAALTCPACGEHLASYEGETGKAKCKRGHGSVVGKGTATAAVAKAPARTSPRRRG